MTRPIAALTMLAVLAAAPVAVSVAGSQSAHADDGALAAAAQRIEAELGARVGLSVYDTGSGTTWRHRADERFAMASTFKVLACGALLAGADAGSLDPEQRVEIGEGDILSYAPVTEQRVGETMSLGALCEATMRTSDNTAANLVLDALGGPAALTGFVRALGDEATRLDRREPELNQATPGDPRDTTTPAAMTNTLRTLVLGDALTPGSRERLRQWLVGNEVGGPLLRAGIPADWRIGDRTGAGGHGTRGIVAVLWPPQRAPLVAAIYITETDAAMDRRNAAIAALGAVLTDVAQQTPQSR